MLVQSIINLGWRILQISPLAIRKVPMPRLNLEKMSFAELSKLRLHVDRLMADSEKSALRQKMAEMAEAAGMSLDALFGKARKGKGSMAVK